MPDRLHQLRGLDNPATPAIALGALAGLLLIVFVPFRSLVGLAAISFLWSAALIHLPDLLQAEPNLPPKASDQTPLSSTLSRLDGCRRTVITVRSPYRRVWMFASVWVATGILFYSLYARRHGQTFRREQVVVDEEGDAESVLSPPAGTNVSPRKCHRRHHHPGDCGQPTALGFRIGEERVAAMWWPCRSSICRNTATRPAGRKPHNWNVATLSDQLSAYDYGAPIRPTVRLAPSYADGIMEAIREEQAGWVLMGWTGDAELSDDDLDAES